MQVGKENPISIAAFAVVSKADLVVALLSNPEPEILYGMGLAHAAGKVIILVDSDTKFPVSATNSHSIFFDPAPDGLGRLTQTIRRNPGDAGEHGANIGLQIRDGVPLA
jgi:hypothetical protein